MTDLRTSLAAIPDPMPPRTPEVEHAIAHSVEYLGSDAAQHSLDADPYWPKWDSPWWHLLALHELGEARRIPARAATKLVERLNALPITIFPILPDEMPPGADPYRDTACHCAVGCIDQVLAECGVDVDRAVPWIAPWLGRYQLADGGLNCDNGAYTQGDDCPSSMVATVPLFEALLARPERTPEQRVFVARAAQFLVDRELRHGSRSRYNAEEREAAPAWLAPCFPRLYFYDVLRGLAALVRWADQEAHSIPRAAVASVVEHLVTTAPDGMIRVRRQAHAGMTTLARRDGAWVREPVSTFPLLDVTSVIGAPSEALTRQWTETRHALLRLIDAGRLG